MSKNESLEVVGEELGVGANAESRTDMIFVANDSLCELVWSPHKGLSIRCAVGTVAGKKRSSFFWGAESSDMVLSSPQTNLAEETLFILPSTTSNDDRNMTAFPRQSGSTESMSTSSQRVNNVQDDTIALYTMREDDVSHRIEMNSPGLEEGRLRITLPDSEGGLLKSGSAGEKLDCVAENDLPSSVKFPRDSAVNVHDSTNNETEKLQLQVCEISKAAPITSLASQAKGKERTLSDDDLKKGASQDDEDDSYESVESCNSSRKFNSGKKRVLSFNEQLIGKSKRLKMQIQENPVSSSLTRANSSFANWISAMVKGGLETDISRRDQDKTCDSMGFQSLFQSIYRPSTKVQDKRLVYTNSDDILAIKDNTSKSPSQSVPKFLMGNVGSDALESTATKDVGSSRNLMAGKRATYSFRKSYSDLPSAEKQQAQGSARKDDHLNSLFVSHFCPPKSPRGMSSSDEPTNSSPFRRKINFLPDVEASCNVKEVEAQNINQIVPFQGFQSSEAMVSVFAKRLDALKNIMPTDLTDKSASSATTCFFCGVGGHELRYCPQLTEPEVQELVRNMEAYGGKEEAPCLCIRCFQLNHWAIACPNAPSHKKRDVEGVSSGEIWHKTGFVRNLSLPDVIDRQAQALRVVTGKASSAGVYIPPSAGIFEENASQLPWFPYPCGSLPMPKRIFEAVRSLQLSRTDIMKWMHSIFSTSLDGYYLRLRQKLGGGLGGTQYHVACICSPQQGNSAETSKRPIYVTVGGIRCSVESQYISNQDFLEDELKEWWSATLRGDHGKIPSEDDLRSKVDERRRLGL